jgi:hypothetical protein
MCSPLTVAESPTVISKDKLLAGDITPDFSNC